MACRLQAVRRKQLWLQDPAGERLCLLQPDPGWGPTMSTLALERTSSTVTTNPDQVNAEPLAFLKEGN